MPVCLHRPYTVAVLAESLFCIGPDSCICKDSHGIDVEDESSYIVMIVTFIVVATLCGKEPPAIVPHIAELGLRIPHGHRDTAAKSIATFFI